MNINLVPYPQAVKIQDDSHIEGIMNLEKNDFNDIRISNSANNIVTGTGRKLFISQDDVLTGFEEYKIEFDKETISISSGNNTGAFRALTTLKQLRNNNQIPAIGHIDDEADVEMRIQHIDLKRLDWNFEYLLSLIKRFADMKINYILLEYEDKFKFDFCSEIPVESALNKKQIKQLEDAANDHFIQIIPLVQCIGHYEYILKHEKYIDISENPDNRSQACPLHPETLELFKQMASEVIEAHPSSEFFHIGGDEPFLLGSCPKCKQESEKEGKGTLYAKYLNKAISWVIDEKKKRPLVWADTLLKHDEAVQICRKEVIAVDWDYHAVKKRNSVIKIHQPTTSLFDSEFYMNKLSEEQRLKLDKYLKYDPQDETFESLPHGPYLKACGFDVISAGYVSAVDNILTHSEVVVSNSLKGVMGTYWASIDSICPPIALYEMRSAGICMLAASSWNHSYTDKNRNRFFQIVAEYLTDNINAGSIYESFDAENYLIIPNKSKAYLKPSFDKALNYKNEIEDSDGISLFTNFLEKIKLEKEFSDFCNAQLGSQLLSDDSYKSIDLSTHCNESYTHTKESPGWTRIDQNDLRFFPKGDVCFDGIPFYIEEDTKKAAVMVGNNEELPWHPNKVEKIEVDSNASCISFVHGAIEGKPLHDGTYGEYVIHYSDGETESIPLCNNKNIATWWNIKEVEDAKISWSGKNLTKTEVGLYSFVYFPKSPNKKIEHIDFVCSSRATLALAAITIINPQNTTTGNQVDIPEKFNEFNLKFSELEQKLEESLKSFLTSDGVNEVNRISFNSARSYISKQLKIINQPDNY